MRDGSTIARARRSRCQPRRGSSWRLRLLYAPAYCEDLDLAFKLRRAGFEVWFQPLSIAIHYEGRSHGRDVASGIKAYQVRNLQTFYQRLA